MRDNCYDNADDLKPHIESLLERAGDAFARGHYDEAYLLAERARFADQTSHQAWFLLARIAADVNDNEVADYCFERAIEIVAEYPNIKGCYLHHFGQYLESRGSLQAAYQVFCEANQLNPRSEEYADALARTLAGLGENKAKAGHTDAALEHYGLAYDLRPSVELYGRQIAMLVATQGDQLRADGKYKAALEKYERANTLDQRSQQYSEKIAMIRPLIEEAKQRRRRFTGMSIGALVSLALIVLLVMVAIAIVRAILENMAVIVGIGILGFLGLTIFSWIFGSDR